MAIVPNGITGEVDADRGTFQWFSSKLLLCNWNSTQHICKTRQDRK